MPKANHCFRGRICGKPSFLHEVVLKREVRKIQGFPRVTETPATLKSGATETVDSPQSSRNPGVEGVAEIPAKLNLQMDGVDRVPEGNSGDRDATIQVPPPDIHVR